jgi:glutamate/tyrosine decarboxylase-like PLP-dependent enzyme
MVSWFQKIEKGEHTMACMHNTEQHNVVLIAGKTHWFRIDSVEQLSNVTQMVSAKDGSN